MSDLHQMDRRYDNDAIFRCMVDSLQGVLESLMLTPSEIREAAIYAAYRVEVRRLPPAVILRGQDAVDWPPRPGGI